MILHPPFLIGSRLLPALRIGDVWVSLEHIGCADSRMVFRYYLDGPDWCHEDSDLRSGCQGATLQKMFGTLLAFLSACAEGRQYQTRTGRKSENGNLFPERVGQWAEENSDEISSLWVEIEESNKTLIVED